MTAERRTDLFIARLERLAANTKQAESLTVQPAVQTMPDGGREPAILLRSAGQIHGVLPLGDALRLANEIADTIAAHRTGSYQ